MIKWPEIRDSLIEAMHVKEVGNDLKNDFIKWLGTEGLDFVQAFVDEVIKECKEDAPTESGWCKIRDGVVLPVVLNVGMYVLKLVLEKSAEK
jgi:hypothetical protein